MGAFHNLRIRHNKFVENIDNYAESVINGNKSLVNLNIENLEQSLSTKDSVITPKYAKSTASYKGFVYPDLHDTGDLYKSLNIEANKSEYTIFGTVPYFEDLLNRYKNAFGVAKSKQPKAKNITTSLLGKLYKKIVFK